MRQADATFATLLRRHRLLAGLSQEELAERARVSLNAVGALERGINRQPHPRTVALLAEALRLNEEQRAELLRAVDPTMRPRREDRDEMRPGVVRR